ncbi:MAG: TIGR01459 family HAD-type hydrolase [Kiloniellales bacterium]
MTVTILPGLSAVAGRYDGFILDLWGVLHDGERPLPGVLDGLERLRRRGKRVVILSNAPRRVDAAVARLQEIGIPRRLYDGLMTSGEEAYQHLLRRDDPWYSALGRACLHLGPARDKGMLDGLELTQVATAAEADFVLNTGTNMDGDSVDQYRPLLRAAHGAGLPMVCANPDLEVLRRGRREICAGTLAQCYEALGGEVRWHGKPFPSVYQTCFRLLGIEARERILAVGDSLRTDVAGAANVGIDALLVTGGIHAAELGMEVGGTLSPRALTAACERAGQQPMAAVPGFAW